MFGPDFTKDQRVLAKTINFGIAYGRGASSIAEVFDMSVKDAQKMIDDWFKPMPVLKQWILAKRRAPLRGEACTTPFGRRRHFVITDDNIYHVQNEAINFPIQSVASDLTLLSLLELHDQLKERDLGHIVNTVHDSIIIETTNDNAQAVVDLGVSILRNTPIKLLNSKVPFNADAEIGPLWGELEAVDSE
jgi:DNA polymerase-1